VVFDAHFRMPGSLSGALFARADCSNRDAKSLGFCLQVNASFRGGYLGHDFGHHGTGRFVRLSYASSMAQLHEAVDRLGKLLLQRA
jgi:aspartate/methionine/tyrosine aminotransferase